MSLEIKIEIPPENTDAADLVAYFQERLSMLADAIDRNVADFDERAQIDEIHVTKAEVSGECLTVTYELRFSAFYACSEIDYRGHHQRILSGHRVGDFWIFQPHQPTPSRSTLDEF